MIKIAIKNKKRYEFDKSKNALLARIQWCIDGEYDFFCLFFIPAPFKKLQIQLSILKPKLTNPSHANDIYIYMIHDILLLTLIRNINLMI